MQVDRLTGCVVALAVSLVTSAPADAGPRRKKPVAARVELAAAVATSDPVAMCRAAIAATTAGDHARASLVLPACEAAIISAPDLTDQARTARLAIARTAARQDWSPVELMVRPAGATATLSIDAFAGLPVPTGRVLLPAGTYRVTARNTRGEVSYDLAVADGSRALVLIDLPTASATATAGVLDFTDGEPAATVAGPPPVIRRGSLLPERYRRGLAVKPSHP